MAWIVHFTDLIRNLSLLAELREEVSQLRIEIEKNQKERKESLKQIDSLLAKIVSHFREL